MKNLILGIEKTCLKPLFKPISIFEKKMNIGVEFWVSEFLRYFYTCFCIASMSSVLLSLFWIKRCERSI